MTSRIYTMALCGEYIAANTGDTIRFHHADTGMLSSLPFIQTSAVWALAYMPIQKWLLAGYGDGVMNVWDISSGKNIFAYPAPLRHTVYPPGITAVAASPDGTSFVAIDDIQVCVWNTHPFQEQDILELSWEPRLGLYLSNDEVILGDLMNDLHIYHVKEKTKEVLPIRLLKGMAHEVIYASTRDELYIFTHMNIIRYSLKQRQVLDYFLDIEEEPPLYNHYPTLGALSSQQDVLISADTESDHILILDAVTGAIRTTFQIPEQGIHRMMLSSDDRILFTQDKSIRAWDLTTQKELFQIEA